MPDSAANDERVTITLSRRTVQAAMFCLNTCASDEEESGPRRNWYTHASDEIAGALPGAEGTGGDRDGVD